MKVKRGLYDVTASVAEAIPAPVRGRAVVPGRCWQGENKQVQVHRHRFARVELHVQNACIV